MKEGEPVRLMVKDRPCTQYVKLSTRSGLGILLNMIFTEMLRKITGWQLTDVRSGYMGFRLEDVRAISHDIIVKRYGIPMELLLRVWNIKPNAYIHEIAHPAMYDLNISDKLRDKYVGEGYSQKGDRLKIAYAALLSVVEDLKIPREVILEMNGFKKTIEPTSAMQLFK